MDQVTIKHRKYLIMQSEKYIYKADVLLFLYEIMLDIWYLAEINNFSNCNQASVRDPKIGGVYKFKMERKNIQLKLDTNGAEKFKMGHV